MTIRTQLQQNAARHADTAALYFPQTDTQCTYAELQHRIAAYHNLFSHYQIKPHGIFACGLNNGIALVELTLAAYYHNRIITPLNLVAGETNLSYVITHCRPQVLFCDDTRAAMFTEIIKSNSLVTKLITIDPKISPLHQLDIATYSAAQSPPSTQSNALLIYTSGTTGKPKGVMLTHRNLLAGGSNTALAHQLTPADVGLCVLPLYHINAQCVSLMAGLVSGASIVLAEKFSVQAFFAILEKYKVSWASVVPTMLAFLANALGQQQIKLPKHGLPNLRFLRSASAPLPIEIHKYFEQLLNIPIIETMGITETAAQILANPLPPAKRKIGSAGIAFGNEIKIIDEASTVVTAGCSGELCIRGDNVMSGYFNNPTATKESFTADGWFRSGDLAYQDTDGFIFITGRIKELIIKGGENIAPREIDEILYQHPAVIEAAAFGIACKQYGQRVAACVKITAPYANRKESLAGELINLCIKKIGEFKSPEVIYFVDELPKGPSGKIQRLKLAEMCNVTSD